MKKAILLLTLVSSMTAFAESDSIFAASANVTFMPTASIGVSTIGLASSSGHECSWMVCKEAAQVLVDGQEYIQSGTVTAFLDSKIKNVQATDATLSSDEAFDVLVNEAQAILK